MYGNIYDEEERFERQAVFPKLLAKHAEDFSWVKILNVDEAIAGAVERSDKGHSEIRTTTMIHVGYYLLQNKTSFNRDAIKAGTGRRYNNS